MSTFLAQRNSAVLVVQALAIIAATALWVSFYLMPVALVVALLSASIACVVGRSVNFILAFIALWLPPLIVGQLNFAP